MGNHTESISITPRPGTVADSSSMPNIYDALIDTIHQVFCDGLGVDTVVLSDDGYRALRESSSFVVSDTVSVPAPPDWTGVVAMGQPVQVDTERLPDGLDGAVIDEYGNLWPFQDRGGHDGR